MTPSHLHERPPKSTSAQAWTDGTEAFERFVSAVNATLPVGEESGFSERFTGLKQRGLPLNGDELEFLSALAHDGSRAYESAKWGNQQPVDGYLERLRSAVRVLETAIRRRAS